MRTWKTVVALVTANLFLFVHAAHAGMYLKVEDGDIPYKPVSVAVLPVENNFLKKENQAPELAQAVTSKLENLVVNNFNNANILDRRHLKKIQFEMGFSEDQVTTLQELGTLLRADFLLIGSIDDGVYGGSKYKDGSGYAIVRASVLTTLKLVKVKTGEIVAASSQESSRQFEYFEDEDLAGAFKTAAMRSMGDTFDTLMRKLRTFHEENSPMGAWVMLNGPDAHMSKYQPPEPEMDQNLKDLLMHTVFWSSMLLLAYIVVNGSGTGTGNDSAQSSSNSGRYTSSSQTTPVSGTAISFPKLFF